MKILRKVLIVILLLVLAFLIMFFFVLLGAPHFQGDDMKATFIISCFVLILLAVVLKWKPNES
jgi:hypothetical protein